jgi:hypothetical protein
MMQALSRRTLILVGIAVLIAGAAWYGLSNSSTSSSGLVTTPISTVSSPAEQGLIATLLTLRAVKLDGTIFSDPVFMSLKDFSTEIVAEPVGRENPFAPLPSRSLPSESTTQGAKIFQPR